MVTILNHLFCAGSEKYYHFGPQLPDIQEPTWLGVVELAVLQSNFSKLWAHPLHSLTLSLQLRHYQCERLKVCSPNSLLLPQESNSFLYKHVDALLSRHCYQRISAQTEQQSSYTMSSLWGAAWGNILNVSLGQQWLTSQRTWRGVHQHPGPDVFLGINATDLNTRLTSSDVSGAPDVDSG